MSFPPVPTTARTSTGERSSEPTELPTTLVTDTRPPPRPTRDTTRARPTTFDTSTRVSSSEGPPSETSETGATGTVTKSSQPPPGATSGDSEEENDDDDGGDDDDDDDDDDGNGGDPPLSTAQITGISVGIAGAAVVAIVTIILARRCRRDRHPDAKTGFLPRRSTWGYNLTGDTPTPEPRRNTRFSLGRPQRDQQLMPKISSVPPPPAYSNNSYNRTSWVPQAIGLALSPPLKREAAPESSTRRISKLLPAKPVMPPIFGRRGSPSTTESSGTPSRPGPEPQTGSSQTLPIAAMFTQSRDSEEQQKSSSPKPLPPPPQQQPLPQRPPPVAQPPSSLKLQIPADKNLAAAVATAARARDSEMTEFEEDGVLSAVSQEGQIWRPPSAAPLSATAPYYVADKNGNWVLASSSSSTRVPSTQETTSEPKSAPPSGPVKPMAFPLPPSSALGHSKTVSHGREMSKPSLGPPANITRNPSMATSSSSIYSQHSSIPKPLFYQNGGERRQSGPRRSTSQGNLDRTSSRNSDVTLFENSSDESKEPTPPEIRGSLSPVVESPRSTHVRSPAPPAPIQNREQRDGRSRPVSNAAPPPRRPFAYFPPGQPSPTLGLMNHQQPPGASGLSSYNVPHNGRRPMQPPGMTRTGSPTMRVVEPSPEPDDRTGLPSAQHRPRQPSNEHPQAPEVRLSPRQDQIGFQSKHWTQQQQQQHQRQPRPDYQYPPVPPQPAQYQHHHYPRAPAPYKPPFRPGPQRFPPHQQAPPRQDIFVPSSASHGPRLLPRLDTADQTMMPPAHQSGHFQSPISDISTSSSLLAKRLGSDRAAQMSVSTDPDQQYASFAAQTKWQRDGKPATPRHAHDLPTTPGWMPRLTPTRRGEDLFLNVH